MYKIGLSCLSFDLTEDTFQKLAQNDIGALEINVPLAQHNSLELRQLAELSRRYHVELWSYHLPYMPFREVDISSADPELRAKTVALFTRLIEKAADVGMDKFVVHPSGEPVADNERSDRLQYAMESLDTLAEAAAKHGAVIAVEDLPRTCLGNTAEEIGRLLSANDKLRVCFDSNHLLKGSNLDFIEAFADKIVTVHISDYDFTNEKHWLPGEGKVDWQSVYQALQQAGYRGVWLYEIPLQAPKTLARSRNLTFADFAQNAHAIFANKSLQRVL